MFALLLSRNPDLTTILHAAFKEVGIRLSVADPGKPISLVATHGAPLDLVVLDCTLNLAEDAVRCYTLFSSLTIPILTIQARDAALPHLPQPVTAPLFWMPGSLGLVDIVGFLRGIHAELLRMEPPRRRQQLSRRQLEVASMVLTSTPTAEIAAKLQLHPGTVKRHLERAKEKLGVRTARELAAALKRSGEDQP